MSANAWAIEDNSSRPPIVSRAHDKRPGSTAETSSLSCRQLSMLLQLMLHCRWQASDSFSRHNFYLATIRHAAPWRNSRVSHRLLLRAIALVLGSHLVKFKMSQRLCPSFPHLLKQLTVAIVRRLILSLTCAIRPAGSCCLLGTGTSDTSSTSSSRRVVFPPTSPSAIALAEGATSPAVSNTEPQASPVT